MANTLVYLLDNKIYINLTNRCTNNCIFCLRNDKDDVCGQKLWLDTEDFAASDVIEQFQSVLKKAGTSFKNLLSLHPIHKQESINPYIAFFIFFLCLECYI